MHMLRIVLLGWHVSPLQLGSYCGFIYKHQMPSSQSFCCTFLQPTVVDLQQIRGGKTRGRSWWETWWGSSTLVSLRMCCLSTIDSEAACCYWLPKITNLRWLHHLPNCRNAISVSLHCFLVVVVVVVVLLFDWFFWRGKFRNGTYTKLITTLIPFLSLRLRRN